MTFNYTHSANLESSVLDSLYYNEQDHRLAVEFNNGTVLVYADQTLGDYDRFVKADSPGKVWNEFYRWDQIPERFTGLLVDANTEAAVLNEYTFHFLVNGNKASYTLSAPDLSKALESVENIASMIDVTFDYTMVEKAL